MRAVLDRRAVGIDPPSQTRRHDIAVCAHLGLKPQSVHKTGGFKVQGREEAAAKRMLDSAKALESAGADSVLLECIPSELGKRITESLEVPVSGIGAHSLMAESGASKSGGSTPTISCGTPFSAILRPTAPASLPNLACHNAWPSTTTRCWPGVASSRRNVRPRAGCTRNMSKNGGDTPAAISRTGSPVPVRSAVIAM